MSKSKTILEKTQEQGPQVLDVNFLMEEATLKKGQRKLKFSVGTTLQKTVRFYRITLYFNDEPYLAKIEANKRVIEEINTTPTLFDQTKEGDITKKSKVKKLKDENDKVEEEMDALEQKCEEFEFTGEAEKVEYNKETLTLKIDKDTLAFLNMHADLFVNYKMLLSPIY